MSETLITSRDPKGLQAIQIFEAVYNKMGLTPDEAQCINERGDELKKGFETLLQDLGQFKNEYSGETINRTLGYPTGIQVPSVEEQCNRLSELHPGINLEHVESLVEGLGEKPEGANGILIRSKLEYLGRRFDIAEPYTIGYGQLLEVGLFPMIGESRNFRNYRAGELTPEHIRLHSQVLARYQAVEEATPGDVVVSYFACGINPYKQEQNFSLRNFRLVALKAGNLPLCAVDIAGIILLMPDRLTKEGHLYFNCSDEHNWRGDGFESYCPCFRFDDGQLEFLACWSCSALQDFGSPVAFGSDVTRE